MQISFAALICSNLVALSCSNLAALRPKKNISVVRVPCQKKLGRVGREFFFFKNFFLYCKMYTNSPRSQFFHLQHIYLLF